MSKRTKILMLTNIIAVILLVSNFSSIQAVPPGWNAGDIYLWGTYSSTRVNTYDEEEGIGSITEVVENGETEYNITALNTMEKEYDAFRTDATGQNFLNDRNYDAQDFVNNRMQIDDFFNINFVWDYEHNVTSMILFETDFQHWYLIEPNFVILNKQFPVMLNGSYLIDTVNDPYVELVHNFTLGDVLDYGEIKIMGRSSLENAVKQFTETKTKWTMEFDFSNFITHRIFNGTMWIHYPYTLYKNTWEIKYSEAGVLDTLIETISYILIIDGETTEYNYERRIIIGGMKAASAPLNTLSIIGGIVFAATISLVIKRRKK